MTKQPVHPSATRPAGRRRGVHGGLSAARIRAALEGGGAPPRGADTRRRGVPRGGPAGGPPRSGTPESRRLLRQRLAFLALVLFATMVVAPLVGLLSPAKGFAVASGSMEPVVGVGDLVVTAPGDVRVGDIIVYESPLGERQMHRVERIVEADGHTRYVTRGDANEAMDSAHVDPDDVVGRVELRIPLVGHIWLWPVTGQILALGGAVMGYIGIALYDAGLPLVRWTRRLVPFLILPLLVAPGALGGITSVYPAGTQTADIVASPLPLAAGDEGSASVSADSNSATATAPPPELWKEIPLHGGDEEISVTGTSYATLTEDRVVVDLAEYAPAPTFYLEATMKAGSGESVSVQLYDRTADAAVAGAQASTDATAHTRVQSGGFTLSGSSEYTFQAKVSGGTGAIHQVKLLSMQETPVASTATHVRMSGADSTDNILSRNVDAAAYWRYDGSALDGAVTAYLEIVAEQSHSGTKVSNGRVHLRDLSASSNAATIVLSDGPAARYTVDVSDDLVDGREYTMRFRAPDATLGGTTNLHHARLVIEQDDFTKTVSYIDLAGRGTTTADNYTLVEYLGRHHAESEEDGVATAYFETTIKNSHSVSGSTQARLYDHLAGAAVAGSEVSEGGLDRDRARSAAISLNSQDATYQPQLKGTSGTTATIYSAWIILHEDLSLGDGLRWDHVLESRVQTPVDTCSWQYSLSGVSSTSVGRLQRADVDWRVGGSGTSQETPLPSARQFTSAVWDGTHAYVFGGTDGTRTDHIVRYDPATDTVTTMSATLPTARAETSAVWTGTHAYVFGGNGGAGANHLDDIVRYDPATDTVTTVAQTLPSGLRHTSAVWDGSHAYIFGGITSGGNTDQILKYDPSAGTVTTLSATLPTARYGTSAVWDGTHAYVLGGSDGGFVDDIVRFDPATGKAKLLEATLPTARYYTSAVWVGTYAYVFGGWDTDYRDGIDRFDPVTGRVITLEETLPTARYGTSAVWDGAAAHVFGGLETGSVDSDDIVRFNAPVQVLGVGGIQLPTGRDATSAVWTGAHAYVFGGRNNDGDILDGIVRYDPATQQVDAMQAVLPAARREASAVWDGSHVYIFGGTGTGGRLDDIVRYDPATDTATTMTATLPSARDFAAAVWDGSHAYLFGGRNSAGNALDEIVRYDPAGDTVTTMTATLPSVRQLPSAVWDGSHAYIFGGSDGTDRTDQIVRYDTGSDTITAMTATLPSARSSMTAAWDGSHAYLFGGFGPDRLDAIVRYDPAGDAVATMTATLPTARNLASAVWDGSHAYVFGGQEDGFTRPDDILRYDPGSDALEDAEHLVRESGQSLRVAPGGTLQTVMDTKPDAQGDSDLSATLDGRCVGFGIHTEQAVTYRFG